VGLACSENKDMDRSPGTERNRGLRPRLERWNRGRSLIKLQTRSQRFTCGLLEAGQVPKRNAALRRSTAP
jgi:hypothetical protein